VIPNVPVPPCDLLQATPRKSYLPDLSGPGYDGVSRFGLLYLRGGRANGRQVVPEAWVKESTTPSAPFNQGYGLHWWLGTNGDYMASGLAGQKLYVSPEHQVVIVTSTLATVLGEEETETAFRAVAAAVARTRVS